MRTPRLLAITCAIAGAVVLVAALKEPVIAAAREQSNIDRGFELAPVQLNLRGKNRRLVGLGSYLVNTSGCNDCHTNPAYAPGGNPHFGEPKQINAANYLAGGFEIVPGITSTNITPDVNGLPGSHNYTEFLSQMRTGSNHHRPGDVLQVMPWPFYRNMTDIELRAIYEYLRAIPHAEPATPVGIQNP